MCCDERRTKHIGYMPVVRRTANSPLRSRALHAVLALESLKPLEIFAGCWRYVCWVSRYLFNIYSSSKFRASTVHSVLQVWGACSDVSRTWPVNGRFSRAQRVVYEHVADVHRACVARCQAGDSLADVHALSVRMLQRALVDLGVRLPPHEYRQVYPHSVGHWLGWDTHDVASVGQATELQPGVILTIEPGTFVFRCPPHMEYA